MNLKESLSKYPKENLTRTPTPLQHLPHLSDQLGTQIYLKRDDLTDLTLGGDKPRKLEYEIAQARANGADTLVTCGSTQSNHARLTTAAARKVGMECSIVLSHDMWHKINGNLLTVYLMGAQVQVVKTEDHWDLEKHALECCDRLKAKGRNPHFIPVSGTTPHSCLGYVNCGLEIMQQLDEQDIHLDAVYTPFGTGGIFTSLMFAMRNNGVRCPFIGISVNRNLTQCRENLDKWWTAISDLLPTGISASMYPFEIYDGFIGKEYGDPTEACLDAIVCMAQAEGILLDPVYSGKVASGFLAHCKEGRWSPEQSILLLHSGGVPAIFAYHEPIETHLLKRGILPAS